MSKSTVERLIHLPKLLRSFEHHLEEGTKELVNEFEKEAAHLDSSDLGSRKVKKMRRYLRRFYKDLNKRKYKKAGKDLEKVLSEVDDLEKQLGHD